MKYFLYYLIFCLMDNKNSKLYKDLEDMGFNLNHINLALKMTDDCETAINL